MRSNWFDGLETKGEMNDLVIGEIEAIMGDLSTSANEKVIEIARALDGLNKAWNAKKDSSPQGAPKENSHLDCTIDLSKVESLLEPWTREQLEKAIIGIDLANGSDWTSKDIRRSEA